MYILVVLFFRELSLRKRFDTHERRERDSHKGEMLLFSKRKKKDPKRSNKKRKTFEEGKYPKNHRHEKTLADGRRRKSLSVTFRLREIKEESREHHHRLRHEHLREQNDGTFGLLDRLLFRGEIGTTMPIVVDDRESV